jgi:hypothetical protein
MIEHHHNMVYGKSKDYPKMVYGPNGETHTIENEGDPRPKGYKDHPREFGKEIEIPEHVKSANAGAASTEAKPGDNALDTDGHVWDAKLHAATKGKTKAGLWRMNVGQTRPAPMPGFPKEAGEFDI